MPHFSTTSRRPSRARARAESGALGHGGRGTQRRHLHALQCQPLRPRLASNGTRYVVVDVGRLSVLLDEINETERDLSTAMHEHAMALQARQSKVERQAIVIRDLRERMPRAPRAGASTKASVAREWGVLAFPNHVATSLSAGPTLPAGAAPHRSKAKGANGPPRRPSHRRPQ